MNSLLIGVLVFGLLFGGFTGAKISNLNPFKSNSTIQKSENNKEEHFQDTVKGIEYTIKENSKNVVPTNVGNSLGQRIGSFIDSSIQLIIWGSILGLILLFFTGINIFKYIKTLITNLNAHRLALKQTVQGIENSKPKLNGTAEVLKTELSKVMDTDTKRLIDDIKKS